MKLIYVRSNQTNPYLNIAVENYLLAQPEDDAVCLYLWQNHRTVVIGQNQNPFSECDVDALEADGGYLMRRRTGGGAVYHDEGNLNFSFIVSKRHYDQARQFEVLGRAVAAFGIKAEVSGRNDVLADGRKFSGNAFSKSRYQDLHHGTILIKGNMADLQRYLRPKPSKLLKHGVSSVKSRVVNLSELNPEITRESLVPHLYNAFAEVYGAKPQELNFDELAQCEGVQSLYREFASDKWKYANWRTFTATRSGEFDWGGVEVSIKVEDGIITDIQIASDALDIDAIDHSLAILRGAKADCRPTATNQIENDIIALVYG